MHGIARSIAQSQDAAGVFDWFTNASSLMVLAMSESYYKTINGVKYDRGILEAADKAVSGQGDGRISIEDAKKMIEAVKDGNKYTETEKTTMAYVRDNYKFTKEADDWFRTEIRKWAASK